MNTGLAELMLRKIIVYINNLGIGCDEGWCHAISVYSFLLPGILENIFLGLIYILMHHLSISYKYLVNIID